VASFQVMGAGFWAKLAPAANKAAMAMIFMVFP
jgi:hypothetical protein